MQLAADNGIAADVAFTMHVIQERRVAPVLQPIVDLTTGAVMGVEALARGPADTPLQRPDQLFAAASRAGLLGAMDMLCAERALESALTLRQPPPLVFLNAEPAVLDQPLSARLLTMLLSGLPFRVVTEFTERALPTVPAALLDIAELSHRLGNAIALDDVGADPMSLAFLPLVDPDVIKLDMHLLRHPSAVATAEICGVVSSTARRTGARIIAEGIETAADVVTARSLGAHWGQGWHFGRPAPPIDLHLQDIATTDGLRPARPGQHQPTGSPHEVAAAAGCRRLDDAAARRAMERAASVIDGQRHAVVLGSYCTPDVLARWQPQVDRVSRLALYTALLSPDSEGTPFTGEGCLVVMTPNYSMALCHQNDGDVLHTEDPDEVALIGRVILQRLKPRRPK
ncbi:EAL domain-containing protein [Actinoplanes couchii]|uniref:EAL domain-containing protein n=1 Tax=Actinoplanes couchii TaxID=403638 RepID=A0ABQ3XSZ3_9ACTN|nr:EAL domain-containing protein [Actinoplanes couchii]MDR6324103.1 EAL domain-containing protein (putative c-di-GMP-specific phosphodiesterase class I) [Actinoplanes couchii]GID61628.1 hypothetical protein Aco03nite_100320 [Actinoplanes couchii]